MKEEIKQHNQTILSSKDGCTIPVIFNNLTGKNFTGKEYNDYICFVAFRDMKFTEGEIQYYRDDNLVDTGIIKFKK